MQEASTNVPGAIDADRRSAVSSARPVLGGVPLDGRPAELELRPIEGIAGWTSPRVRAAIFRLLSMSEQPTEAMSRALTPVRSYYRRDRHRHPRLDPAAWRLRVSGVAAPRELCLEELRALPRAERVCVMECAGNGNRTIGTSGLIGQARWSGPALEDVLAACGGPGRATHFAFRGLDPLLPLRRGYHYGLSLEELRRAGAIVALAIDGEPLPRARGFPARLVVPGIYAMSHVKWLGRVEGKTAPHRGIHNRLWFTNKARRDGRWVRVQARWIGLKSLVTRCRRADDGWTLAGWAWGGSQAIAGVEVSTDGGGSWRPADVQAPGELLAGEAGLARADHAHAWSTWSWRWRSPPPGKYLVGSRARAADGSLQRLEPDPDVRGHFDQTRVQWRRVRVP